MCVWRILAIPPVEFNDILVQLKYKHLCLNIRDLSILQAFIALLSLFAEATTGSQWQKALFILFVAASVLAVVFDLINEKEKIEHTRALGGAFLCAIIVKICWFTWTDGNWS